MTDASKGRKGRQEPENGDDMSTAAPEAPPTPTDDDPVVQFGGRIPTSLRRRVRVYAAASDKEVAQILREALEEYLTRKGR